MTTRKLSAHEATSLAEAILRTAGLSTRDTAITAAHLVAAELRGYPGHGLRRLLSISDGSVNISDASENEVLVQKPGFVLFGANGRLGIPAVEDAINAAAEDLEYRASIVFGVRGYRGTTGSLGIYGATLASRGVTSILMCNSEFAVAPHGSVRPVLGTNPIAISMPGNPTAFSADIATAAWSYGAIRDAAVAGQRVPLGIVQTEDGSPSTDPNDADRGSLLPMAGHKGYALGLAIELLAGPLLGAKAGRDAVKGDDGFFGVLIRTDAARPAEAVNAAAQALFSEIRVGPPAKADVLIRIPGEKALASQAVSHDLEVPESLMSKLVMLTQGA